MKKSSVDYEKISPVYDIRYESSPLEGIENLLDKLISTYKPKKILEVGCGTGHWIKYLSKYDVTLFGGDYSLGMLKQSSKNLGMEINLFNSDANCLSCKPLSFDLIICINAIHHFNYKIKFIEDSIKLLKKNGVLCIIGLDPRDDKNDWYLYKYFTRTYGLDLERFPSFQQLHEVMKNNGFINIYQKFVHKVESQKIGNEVLKDHFLDKRGASQLALLTDEEYQVGITKIKKDIEEAEKASRKIVFKTLLNFYSILGIKN